MEKDLHFGYLSRRNSLQFQLCIILMCSMASAVLGVYESSHHNNHQSQKPSEGGGGGVGGGGGNEGLLPITNNSSASTGGRSPQHVSWADAVFNFIHTLDCSQVFFTTERECNNLKLLSKASMNIYLAGPFPAARLSAVLPDGGLARAGVHDGYVTLDPYPGANFGHLVLIFHVTMYLQEQSCAREDGIYIHASGDCLILALKRRCKNALERRWRRRNFARRCEINFLPLVYLETDMDSRRQMLTCRDDIPGFAPCPLMRPVNETSELFCNPIRENTKRCETSHERVHTSCRVFEICDQAVLLTGGWNREGSLPRHIDNVKDVFRMVTGHGFKKRNIKIFFANGIDGGITAADGSVHDVYPAALKLAMRYHIQKMCTSPHCVDSLLFYLNGPAKSDGTILLWDVDGDGIASEKERYSLEEILSDLSDCQARQVHLLVDQSFAGEVSRAVKRSKRHRNVVVYAGSKDHEYSYGSDYTHLWTSQNHTHKCAQDVFKETKRKMTHSTPDLAEGEDVANVTIFGAPCDVMPPFNYRELNQNYLGCQNLPTALWVIKFLTATQHSGPASDTRPTLETEFRGSRGT